MISSLYIYGIAIVFFSQTELFPDEPIHQVQRFIAPESAKAVICAVQADHLNILSQSLHNLINAYFILPDKLIPGFRNHNSVC